MDVWAWISLALIVGAGVAARWGYRRYQAVRTDLAQECARFRDLQHAHDLTCQRLAAIEQAAAVLRGDYERTLAAWETDIARCRADFSSDAQASREEIRHLRAHLDQSAAHVKALSEAKALAEAALQARADWTQAFTRNFTPAQGMAGESVEPTGWQCVLTDATGAIESTRAIRDGNAPTRLSRGHGQTTTWYRLIRVDGLSLIYEPEQDPTTTAVM